MESSSDFFGPLPLNSIPASNRVMGHSQKPQVVGEQNESGQPPESRRREEPAPFRGSPLG